MNFVGKKEHEPLSPGASELIAYDASAYLSNKTGVTVSSAAWSSSPSGVSFSSQADTTTKSTVLVTIPGSNPRKYEIKCKFTFSDGAVRTACAPMRIVCD